MSNYIQILAEEGLSDIPEDVAALGDREAATYALLRKEGGAVPYDMMEKYDLLAGSIYPALHTLEDEGFVQSRPSIERPGAGVYEPTGATSGETPHEGANATDTL